MNQILKITSWIDVAQLLGIGNEDQHTFNGIKNYCNQVPQNISSLTMKDVAKIAKLYGMIPHIQNAFYQYFDDWDFIVGQTVIDNATLEKLKIIANKPSLLFQSDGPESEEFSDLKRFTVRRIFHEVEEILKYDETEFNHPVCNTTIEPVDYSSILEQIDSLICISPRGCTIMDEFFSDRLQKYTSTPSVLMKEQNFSNRPVIAMDFKNGTLSNIESIVDMVTKQENIRKYIQLINLSIQNIQESQWQNVITLLQLVSKNNGVLILTGNWAIPTSENLETLVLTDPKMCCHLIWMSKQSLIAPFRFEFRTRAAKSMENIMRQSHINFYTRIQQLKKKHDSNLSLKDILEFY